MWIRVDCGGQGSVPLPPRLWSYLPSSVPPISPGLKNKYPGLERFVSAVGDGLLCIQGPWLIVLGRIRIPGSLHGTDTSCATKSGTRTNARGV